MLKYSNNVYSNSQYNCILVYIVYGELHLTIKTIQKNMTMMVNRFTNRTRGEHIKYDKIHMN